MNFDSIIIIRLSSLGDVVLSTVILGPIRNRFPQAKINFIVAKRYKSLLENNLYINNLVEFEDKNFIKGLRDLCKINRFILGRKTLLINLHPDFWSPWRSALWSFLLQFFIQADYKIKVKKPKFSTLIRNKSNFRSTHLVKTFLDSLKELGLEYNEGVEINSISKPSAVDRNIFCIGISPGASFLTKCWPKERYIELCNRLNEWNQFNIILFGENNESDLINDIQKSINHKKVIAAIGLPLNKVISLINQCSLFISNDSGIMHLAASKNIPTIAIFGPTHPKLGFYPLGNSNIILHSNIECSPCSRWGEKKCKKNKRLCLESITVDDVLGGINTILKLYQPQKTTKIIRKYLYAA